MTTEPFRRNPDTEEATRATFTTRAYATEKPCQLATYHAPAPVMTEGHHVHPVFLQNRLYGRIVDNHLKYLCGNCHDAVHAWLYWLLGDRRQPTNVGRLARAEAELTYAWYVAERERLTT